MLERLLLPGGRVARLGVLAAAAVLLAAVAPGAAGAAGQVGRAAGAGGWAAPSLSCPSTPYGVTERLVAYAPPANGQPLDMDIYQPVGDSQAKHPGVILIHGGGWTGGNFTNPAGDALTTIGDCLAANGFDAFSVDYALSVGGNGSFPENLQDIHAAIGWVKANVSDLDTAQVFALGTSAGANLAELAGENAMGYQDGLLGVIAQSGPADLSAAGMGCASASGCPASSPGAIIAHYLGCYDNTSATCTLYFQNGSTQQVPAPQAYADASSTSSPSATVPYLIANSSDEQIPLAQATDLTQALNRQCAASGAKTSDQLAILPGDQHAVSYSDILAGPMLSFLHAVLAGSMPGNCRTASPLTGAAMAYDASPGAQAAILFGGCCTPQGMVSGATESFDTATGTWRPVAISGPAPVPRLGAAFGYDPGSGTLVLFGGEYLPGGAAQPVALNDTWELSYQASTNTGTWTQAGGTGCTTACPGAPPGRYAASAAQAPHNQGLVLAGGEDIIPATQPGAPSADAGTWLWHGTWTQLTPASSPASRYGAMLAYDSQHNTDVLFGGDNPTSACQGSCLHLLNDTWTLTYTAATGAWTWTQQAAAQSGLAAREFAAGAPATSPPAATAMLSGGLTGTKGPPGSNVNSEQLLADTWTWDAATSSWSRACTSCTLTPPPAFGASMTYHQAAAEDLLYAGYTNTSAPSPPATTWIWTGTWAAR